MSSSSFDPNHFSIAAVAHELKHVLPAQAPLKDFIHHNTLHAFQSLPLQDGIRMASKRFGYRVLLPLKEYRQVYATGRINHDILILVVEEQKGLGDVSNWVECMVGKVFETPESPRIGPLRGLWKHYYKIDLDSLVHPILFRVLCNYLDHGISVWNFPYKEMGFLQAIKQLCFLFLLFSISSIKIFPNLSCIHSVLYCHRSR